MATYKVFDLTADQKKKLTALKRAYNACIKANMLPVNIYGSLTFYDKKYVEEYSNSDFLSKSDRTFDLEGDSQTSNCLSIVNEWTDDGHRILLTEAGLKMLKKEQDDYD